MDFDGASASLRADGNVVLVGEALRGNVIAEEEPRRILGRVEVGQLLPAPRWSVGRGAARGASTIRLS